MNPWARWWVVASRVKHGFGGNPAHFRRSSHPLSGFLFMCVGSRAPSDCVTWHCCSRVRFGLGVTWFSKPYSIEELRARTGNQSAVV